LTVTTKIRAPPFGKNIPPLGVNSPLIKILRFFSKTNFRNNKALENTNKNKIIKIEVTASNNGNNPAIRIIAVIPYSSFQPFLLNPQTPHILTTS
jgi:hypothetical protein